MKNNFGKLCSLINVFSVYNVDVEYVESWNENGRAVLRFRFEDMCKVRDLFEYIKYEYEFVFYYFEENSLSFKIKY